MNKGISVGALLSLVVIGVMGFVLYNFLKGQQTASVPAPVAANPSGGRQTVGNQDLFGQILGAVTSVANAAKDIFGNGSGTAQTQPQTL